MHIIPLSIKKKIYNNTIIPVIIFEGNTELKEFDTIKEAAYWLKDRVGHKNIRFKQVSEGIKFGTLYNENGVTYHFTTADGLYDENGIRLKQR